MKKNQIIGSIGVALLAIGVFLPMITLPLVGSVNYYSNGQGDGILILGIVIVSVILLIMKKMKGLIITGILSFVMVAFTFFQLKSNLNQLLYGDEMGELFSEFIKIDYGIGWIVLVIGSILLLVAGLIKDEVKHIVEA